MNPGFKKRYCLTVWLALFCADTLCLAQGTLPQEEAPTPLSPAEAQRQFKVADGVEDYPGGQRAACRATALNQL